MSTMVEELQTAPPREATRDALTVLDQRTGKSYDLPITDGAIRAIDLRQIKVAEDDFGLLSYDPAFLNTASCRSRITYIDGDKGILRYRGYPIDQLAENATYLEVAYLLLHGELPTPSQYSGWVREITYHTMIHESLKKFMDGFNYDAHPMGMLIGTVAAMSTFYPDARDIHDASSRRIQAHRLIAKMPTLAAFAYRHSLGQPYIYPDNDLPIPRTSSTCCSSSRRIRIVRIRRSSERSTCSSSSTRTTSRTAALMRCAESVPPTPTRTPRSRARRQPFMVHCTAGRTKRF